MTLLLSSELSLLTLYLRSDQFIEVSVYLLPELRVS